MHEAISRIAIRAENRFGSVIMANQINWAEYVERYNALIHHRNIANILRPEEVHEESWSQKFGQYVKLHF